MHRMRASQKINDTGCRRNSRPPDFLSKKDFLRLSIDCSSRASSIEMGSCGRLFHSNAILPLLVSLFTLFGSFQIGSGQLTKYDEIHQAKNLIDALASKIDLNLKMYDNYMTERNRMQNEMELLNKLKGLLKEVSGTSNVCEKFYTHLGFTVVQRINIYGRPLPKDYTVKLEVKHGDLYGSPAPNELRVYFERSEDCQPREIDRILKSDAGKITVLFKLQETLKRKSSVASGSTYYFAYGNKNVGTPKQNPENVYLFYEDFADSNLKTKWQKNRDVITVEGGVLKVKTEKFPTWQPGQISIFAKHGHEWTDIEVEMDFREKNYGTYPGAFLRVDDARYKKVNAWWFQYTTNGRTCAMRPFINNRDGGSRLYRGLLPKQLSRGSWNHAKYRVVGNSFSHWINDSPIRDQDNKIVDPQWTIKKGTFGLGCYGYNGMCETYFDNIKITKYVPVLPTLVLGPICNVNLGKFHKLGTSENPATSCKQIHDALSESGHGRLKNGVYWIKTSAQSSAPTYCEIQEGGWTLIGKISGEVERLYRFWLRENTNVKELQTPSLPSKVACIDARYLAVNHASTIMFASGENRYGIGQKWVRWLLPEGRQTSTFWRHSLGTKIIGSAKMHTVTVQAWNGQEQECYQNKYGIMPLRQHGGSYPAVTYDKKGETKTMDYCMAIGVKIYNFSYQDWSQNGNGFDSPNADSDWPNRKFNHKRPFVTVWLK